MKLFRPKISRYLCLGVLGSLALHAAVMGYPFWKSPRVEAALEHYFSYVPVVLSSEPESAEEGQNLVEAVVAATATPLSATESALRAGTDVPEFSSSFERDGFE